MTTADAAMRSPEERFALLDALRGAAALAVMGIHLGFHSGAEGSAWWGMFTARLNVGVTLFFLLSGFLLYRPYARAVLGHAEVPRLGAYAWKRALRIVPAYWVALSVFAALRMVVNVWTDEWWVYYGFLQPYRIDWFWGGIGPAWSLSTEVAFYATLPLLGALVLRVTAGCTPREKVFRQVVLLSALGLVSLAVRAYSFGHDLIHLTILATFLWFATGMLMAVAHAWREQQDNRSRVEELISRHSGVLWLTAAALFAGICLSGAFPPSFTPGHTRLTFIVEHVSFTVIALLLMLPAVFGEHSGGIPRRILASAVLAWAGRVSYGIFLWHEPLSSALARKGATTIIPDWPLLSLTLVSLPMVLILAWLSYRFVEQPAMRLKNRWPSR